MKRRLIHISIAVVFVMMFSGTRLDAGGHQHLVKKGDTLWDISRKYKVPLKSIIQANSIQSTKRLQIGKKLLIPGAPVEGIWYRVKAGDTLWSIAHRHNVEVRDLQRINSISSPRSLQIGTRIRIQQDGSPGFAKPLRIPLVVTSKYGYRPHPVTGRYQHHEGIDFRAASGTRVYASKAGRVIFAGRRGGYGKIVGIEHAGDFTTWYGHLSRIRVKVGQTVSQGKVIGLSGNTGISTGPHLHFEIRYKGRSEKPTKYITIP
ncbi:peptidase [Candidatus Poribacteria bacterium]|nr:MAG: peptidase [Candidatus Poribacteria bacterium]